MVLTVPALPSVCGKRLVNITGGTDTVCNRAKSSPDRSTPDESLGSRHLETSVRRMSDGGVVTDRKSADHRYHSESMVLPDSGLTVGVSMVRKEVEVT